MIQQYLLVFGMFVSMAAGQSSIQGLKVPRGSRVELEVEIPPSATSRGAPTNMRTTSSASMTQTLLTNMARFSLHMRSITGVPVPRTEEPCPCDTECCQTPMEARRLVPVLNLPMTSHRGCCGCIDCPISSFPLIGYMLMSTVMVDQSAGRSTAGPTK